MLTIVFSGLWNPKTGFDLYMAKRGQVSEPFGKPEVIKACVSPETDSYPSMTADGLELLFERSDANPQWYYSTRETTSAEFGDPVHWSLPATPDGDPAKRRIITSQFVDPLRLVLQSVNLKMNSHRYFLAERADRKSEFASPRELHFSNAWLAYYIVPNRLRAYAGGPGGLFISARASESEPFGKETSILDATVTGPIEAQIWVSPQEDVIFYCSPGPGKALLSRRNLWMVRI